MIDLIVLAGGFGNRIKSVSKGIPKGLLPIDKGVFLDKVFNKIIKFKVRDIYLSLHYKPELFEKYLKDLPKSNRITTVIEPEPLGTGGALNYIIENSSISSPFFVINGDTLTNINLDKLAINFNKSNYDAMIGISFVENIQRYGSVKFNNNCLIEFIEKEGDTPGWINNGYYIINKKVFDKLSGRFSIEQDIFPILANQRRMGIFSVEKDDFIDIGIPEDYKKLLGE